MKLNKIYRNIAIGLSLGLIILTVFQAISAKSALSNNGNLVLFSILIVLSILVVTSLLYVVFKLTGAEMYSAYLEYFEKKKTEDNTVNIVEEETVQEEEKTEYTIEDFQKQILPNRTLKYLDSFAERVLINFGKHYGIVQGVWYHKDTESDKYKIIARYAAVRDKEIDEITAKDGIIGQAILDKKLLVIDNVPADYITIESGLGKSQPASIIIMPLLKDNEVISIIEMATFSKIKTDQTEILKEFSTVLSELIFKFKLR